jgi:hypothetical protein
MNSLANFNYNGTIIQRREDGFVNLTQMCQANGKRLDNWIRLKSTTSYLVTLSNSLQSEVVQASEGANGGTWGHPSVSINLARWLSDDFAVWCDAHIFNLMSSGQTSLDIDPVQMMQLKIELAKFEAEKTKYENKTLELRNTIVKTCSEPVQQKILGYSVIEKVEYRDRVILNNQVINEGNTLNKTELCHRYGILTKNGKPDYRRLNTLLDHKGITERSEAWEMSAVIQENYQFKREYLPVLDSLMVNGDRQLFICE